MRQSAQQPRSFKGASFFLSLTFSIPAGITKYFIDDAPTTGIRLVDAISTGLLSTLLAWFAIFTYLEHRYGGKTKSDDDW
jgi:hypothetical protein